MTFITITAGHTPSRSTAESPLASSSLLRAAVLVAVVTAALLGVTGCVPAPAPEADTPTRTAVTSPAPETSPPTQPPTPTPEPAETQEPPVPAETNITIAVNGTTVTGVLQNNAASASLLAQLPLELSFEDYSGQEKIAGIPAPLSLDGMPPGGSAEPGTIGYYAPDQAIVLYYDTVGYYNGIIPIGTFNDVAAVRDAPAFSGTITATTDETE